MYPLNADASLVDHASMPMPYRRANPPNTYCTHTAMRTAQRRRDLKWAVVVGLLNGERDRDAE